MENSAYSKLIDADSYSGLKGIIYQTLSLVMDSNFKEKGNVTDNLLTVIKDLAELEMGCLIAIEKEKLSQK